MSTSSRPSARAPITDSTPTTDLVGARRVIAATTHGQARRVAWLTGAAAATSLVAPPASTASAARWRVRSRPRCSRPGWCRWTARPSPPPPTTPAPGSSAQRWPPSARWRRPSVRQCRPCVVRDMDLVLTKHLRERPAAGARSHGGPRRHMHSSQWVAGLPPRPRPALRSRAGSPPRRRTRPNGAMDPVRSAPTDGCRGTRDRAACRRGRQAVRGRRSASPPPVPGRAGHARRARPRSCVARCSCRTRTKGSASGSRRR
jgi:hypothetical protein